MRIALAPFLSLILAATAFACFGQGIKKPAPQDIQQSRSKSRITRESLTALHSLRFESTADGSGMVSRSRHRTVRVDPGGDVEIQSIASRKPVQIELHLDGSNSTSIVNGSQALPSRSNYFLGRDATKWRSGVRQFAEARVDGVYPGIDLLYYGNGESLEHDYQLAPGANPALIRMRIGGNMPHVDDASGDLVVSQAGPSTELLRLHKPVAYQSKGDGSRGLVAAAYQHNEDGSFSFVLGDYDRSRPLVIDPLITYSTYFGGTNTDSANDVKLDAAGNIYLLVQTNSVDLPVVSQIAGACSGACGPANPGLTPPRPLYDFYLAKLDPTGQKLLFSTYIGGSQSDIPGELVIASDGTIYISGETQSPDFPVVNEYSNKLAPLDYYGDQTVSTTLTRLSADGSKILYSTLIGGGLSQVLDGGSYNFSPHTISSAGLGGAPGSLAVAPNGIAYLLGLADSGPIVGQGGDFVDAKDASFLLGGGSYIAKFDTTKSGADSLIYARPFGAPGDVIGELFSSIAIDSNQNLWVMGPIGNGATPPTPTPDAVQPVCGAGGASQCDNAFVFELNPAGAITYASFLGGTVNSGGGPPIESPGEIYIDAANNIYLSGKTESVDFPTKNAAYTYATTDGTHGYGFLTKLSPGGESILYSTYFPWIDPVITATSDGLVAAAGSVGAGFPVINGLSPDPELVYGDAVIELIDTTKSGANSLLSSGYMGANGATAQAVTFDAQQNLLLAGLVSGTLPVVDPYQGTCSGGCINYTSDGFLTRIQYQVGKLSLTPATETFASTNVGSTSAPLTATLTNSTAQSITLAVPSLTNSTDFTATDNCNGSLAAGASCTITFNFKPSGVGTLISTYSIGDAGQPNSPLNVQLSGTGIAPAPRVSPASLNFGNVTVGATSSAQVVTVTNTATIPLTFASVGLTGSGFSTQAAGTTCQPGASLAANASCTLSIIFSPATAGAVSGSLTINLPSGFGVSSLTVALTGTGAMSVVSPENIDFTSGFTSTGLTLNGASTVSSGVLQLTANQPSQASSAFYPTAVSTTNFSTDFAFQLLDPLAEGITFTIQGDAPTAIGSNSGGLGYEGIAKSIALKFDLGDAAGDGSNSTGIYVDGAAPTVPATSLAASGIDLHSGDVFALHLSYDGTTESITLMDTATDVIWTTQVAEDIPSILGSSQAYFGFTASTRATSTAAARKSATQSTAKPAAAAESASLGTTANILYWSYFNQSDGVAALQPIQLNFGNVTVGSKSGVQSANLTNTGTAQFQVSSVTLSDPSIVVHTSYCARPVTPGTYCKLEVTVAPTATGAFTGSVVINYYLGDGSTPSQNFTSTLKITAVGIASDVTLMPASTDFGSVTGIQTSPTRIFTVTNNDASSVSLTQITISGPFQIAPGATCIYGMQLPAGQSCAIPVVFAPATDGTNRGALFVSYIGNSTGVVTKTSTLTGTGTGPTAATFTPASQDFGNVQIGGVSSPATFTLTNTGVGPLTVGFPGAINNDFNPNVDDGCHYISPLAPGVSCTITIEFTPSVLGTEVATLSIPTGAGPQTSVLTGRGVGPTATLTPAIYDFGNVELGGELLSSKFTLTNTGIGPLTVGSMSTSDNAFEPSELCGTLAPGASCTFQIPFYPDALGQVTGSLSIPTGAGPQTAVLTGTAVPPAATLTPAIYNFGSVELGGALLSNKFTLTNTGIGPLTVGFMSTSDNAFQPAELCGTLAPGASCTFQILFSPLGALGQITGSLSIPTGAGPQTAVLTGTVVAPPATTPFINFGTGFTADALTLSGPATVASGALQLTSGPSLAASSAFSPMPVPTASFNTNFTFQLLDPTAEGITFAIQNDGPKEVGLGGGGLGYQGLANSIALKFDLKDTAGEGVDSTGVYINGAAPTVPAISLADSGIDLHSGDVFALRISYDGTTMNIALTDTVTKKVWTTQVAEDIPTIIGSNVAYFGFTAGSGTPTLTSNAVEAGRLTERSAITALSSAQPTATSNILTWTYVAGKNTGSAQTITFPPLPGAEYGVAPMKLAAAATSGLPVSYTVTGPAKVSGSTLTITGAGNVTVTATQAGNATFAPAAPVEMIVEVVKASLTVTANDLVRSYSAANPALTYAITGFVDGDNTAVVGGTAVLSTTAVSTSPAGKYPITFTTQALTAANYSFQYQAGTLTVTPLLTQCTVIDYSKGFTSTGITLNGSAKVTNGLLQLTDGKQFEAASAFFSTPVPITSFVTDFTFQLLDPDADGIAFVIQAAGPHALGEGGGGLGYAGIPESIALKFDLHNNEGEGTNSTGLYYNGAFPGEPSDSLDGSGIDLHSGHVFELRIQYDGKASKLTLTDIATKVVLTDVVPGTIAEGLGIDSAYFGFTGGTGARVATQNILTWTYAGGSGCPAN